VVVVWRSSGSLVSVNEINRLYWDGLLCPGSILGVRNLSRYLTSYPAQLNLAIPSWVGAISTCQRLGLVVTLCGWEVHAAGMVRVWVAGKNVCSPCYTQAISELFADVLMINRYINSPSLLYFQVTISMCQYNQFVSN